MGGKKQKQTNRRHTILKERKDDCKRNKENKVDENERANTD